jgi:hypothetical protein
MSGEHYVSRTLRSDEREITMNSATPLRKRKRQRDSGNAIRSIEQLTEEGRRQLVSASRRAHPLRIARGIPTPKTKPAIELADPELEGKLRAILENEQTVASGPAETDGT